MLKIKNLCVSVGETQILDNINLEIKPQTVTALIGKNAAGKSTLLGCLTGERKYTGSIAFEGQELSLMPRRKRAQLISLLPQQLPCPEISGEHLVRLGRTPYLDIGKRFTPEDTELCKRAVFLTKTEALLKKKLSQMSGGEKQKIYLAMLLAQNTPFIAFDEPTSHMDAEHEREFSSLLIETVKKHKKTALVVMHDLTRAVEIADNIAILEEGKIVFSGDSQKAKDSGIIEKTFGVKGYDCEGLRIYR